MPALAGLRRLRRTAADAVGDLPIPQVAVLTGALVLLGAPAAVLAVRMRAYRRNGLAIAVAYMATFFILLVATSDVVPRGARRAGAGVCMILGPTVLLMVLYRQARPLSPRTRKLVLWLLGLGLVPGLFGYAPAGYLGLTVTVVVIVAIVLYLVGTARPPLLVPTEPTVTVVRHAGLSVRVERPHPSLGLELGAATRAYLTGAWGLMMIMILAASTGALIAGAPDDADKQRKALALDDMDVPMRISVLTWTSIVETLVLVVLVLLVLERARRPLTEIVAFAALARALVHLYAGTASLVIAALILGALSILLYHRTRQLVPLICGHAAFDTASVFTPAAVLPAFAGGLLLFAAATAVRHYRGETDLVPKSS
jgi:hypothetical protein